MSSSVPLIAAYKGPAGGDVLTFATMWSRASGRPLHVVTVYPSQYFVGMGRTDAEWVSYNRAEAERLLAEAREFVTDEVVAEYRALASESAPRGLHDAMEQAGAGATVIVGSRKARGLRRTALGSTAGRLLQGAPGPVTLVPWDYETTSPAPLRRVAVAYVDTPDGRAALAGAQSMAAELGAELTVITVLPDTRVTPAMGEPHRFADEQREELRAALEESLRGHEASLSVRSQLLEGPVVDALADLRPEDYDVLVCGSRGYGPARSVLLGGVSSRLLRHARLPVVVVPRG